LNSSIIKGETPDMFVLNNNEVSLYEDIILWIGNDVVNVTDFRKNYKWIFTDDLIVSVEWEGETQEYLKWFPIWYETLWVFYNRLFLYTAKDFTSQAHLTSAIKKVSKRWVVPIALWNWRWVELAWDILAQFFLLWKVTSLNAIEQIDIQKALRNYTKFWKIDGENRYNRLFEDIKKSGETDVDLFIESEVAAIVAYPRVIKRLQTSSLPEWRIFAAAFPHSSSKDGPTLANYNYFVINKDSEQVAVANSLISYMNTDEWSRKYLEKFRYYLPARISLEEELRDTQISSLYKNIVLWDFYSNEALSSFDKANKRIYDENITWVLDDFVSYMVLFDTFREKTLCKSKKILTLENLSVVCD
jgi:hypothetical protein